MEMTSYVIAFIFGTIIGSFLNVVIYRLHTGKSLNGRSHCMSCGEELYWYELFPIVSYLFLRGRCGACSAHIPSRYFTVELLTGLSFLVVWHYFSYNLFLLAVHLILVAILMIILVYDMRHTIIPDELTIAVGAVALMLLGYTFYETRDVASALLSIGAGLCAAFFFWGLWFMSKGRWIGLGDAKLALPLGVVVGIGGVFSMVVLSFWIGAGVSLLLLGLERLLKRGKTHLHFLASPLTIKSEVPFAPFLIAGFLLVHILHADIFTITYALFFGA
jgi:leader peptidase (prepilin peptidase)/N-methyltransferase